MQRAVRGLILGKDYFIDSYADFKTVMLSGWYAMFSILCCLVYLVLDFTLLEFTSVAIFFVCMGLSISSLVLHRLRYHLQANMVLFPSLAITIFLFAASESPATGVSLFFLVISLGALTIFGASNKAISYLFVALVFLLFVVANFSGISILPYRNYNPLVLDQILFINFVISLSGVVLVSVLFIRLNRYTEEKIAYQNELLKRTNADLDRFVYSASHDLRAPLNSILGLIQLTETASDKDLGYYLGLMKSRIDSMQSFIRDVTDFSRNNRLCIEKARVDVAALVMDIWDGLRFIEGADAVRFKLDIDPHLAVRTDIARLKIVLGNLLSNAVRYHDFNHVAPYIRVAAHVEDQVFRLEVQDNGQGIDPQYQQRIFDMFFRANENSKGSGLGLYIVSEVLAKVAGTIEVESVLGKGSTFKVAIPLD